jgi:hypothetical protein
MILDAEIQPHQTPLDELQDRIGGAAIGVQQEYRLGQDRVARPERIGQRLPAGDRPGVVPVSPIQVGDERAGIEQNSSLAGLRPSPSSMSGSAPPR